MTTVVLERVSKSYDGLTRAVADLDLVCRDGEMLALLGPSGCGKSSTLKMIAGLERVSEGRICFDDVDVSARGTAQRNVAMVFEDYALYPHLSVFENIAFPLRLRRQPRAAIGRQVERMLELLDLVNLRDTRVAALSGGAQQRVSIGRALVREPALIMFDEPLSHLDADQKVQLRSEIRRLQKLSGLTSVLVTHDQTEAVAMADRIAVLDHGVLQQVDTPAAIYAHPRNLFVGGFIGEPPMNILDVPWRAAGSGVVLVLGGGLELALPAEPSRLLQDHARGGAVRIGLRPEHVHVQPGDGVGIPGIVTDCEPGGDRDVLRLDTPVGGITAEVGGVSGLEAGTAVRLGIDPGRLHFFDPATTLNLRGTTP